MMLNMGPNTHSVPVSMFKDNRERVAAELRKQNDVTGNAYVLLQGGDSINLYNTDVEYVFRQEPFFTYFFGVREPGCYGAVNVTNGHATLFVPRLEDNYATWMGRLWTPSDFKNRYGVDDVKFVDELSTFFDGAKPTLILTLCGRNSDSGLIIQPATFEGIEKYAVNQDLLYNVASECRVIKSPAEIEVLRYVAKVSSDAHKKVMKAVKPGLYEYQAEAVFLQHSYFAGGCRHASYTCICGSGENSAILHYGHAGAPNEKIIRDGEMLLFDMGANYFGYAADITCSFPSNGKFTDDQKIIYNAVLAANMAVQNVARDGVSWVDMHKLANRVMLTELRTAGLLVGDIDDMMAAGINGIFQPHGLGHLLGLDVHDVGAFLPHCPPRSTELGLKSLRMSRTLKAGMYVTIEPGCYFIDHLLNKALVDPVQKKFLVPEVIARFRDFGGVRIEDDVLITETGVENFAIVPRTVDEIEEFMRS
ncbi:hypothetical protein HA402_008572 [Bradysia odoriphaga]|nr:hypothetical protein HA402_008572 [Bradysia odoriphaga]